MRNNYTTLKKIIVLCIALAIKSSGLFSQTTQTFSFTGGMQSFTVPSCVSSITLDVKGSQGGTNANGTEAGGLGGSAYGILPVTAGDVLNIYVGGMSGYNGGGNPGTSPCTLAIAGYGGGASDIRLNGTSLSNRVIVAAGGGGGGGDRINLCGRGTGGGGGGGYYGGGGGSGYPQNSTTVPTGGSQSAGGLAGTSTYASGQNGYNGALGIGGDGGFETTSSQGGANNASPGGSGGGLTGSSGQQPSSNVYTGQSGAGGSSYLGPVLTSTSTSSGVRSGNGIITLSYTFNGGVVSISPTSATICSGSSATLNATNGLTNYTWVPVGAFAGSSSQSIAPTPTVTTVFTVQSTNTIGCVSYATALIIVNTTPSISLATSASSVCLGQSVTIGATGVNSYTFSNGIGNGTAFTPSLTNTYTISGTNACGTTTAYATITVTPLPVVASASNMLVCSGAPVNILATGASNYTWTSPTGSTTGGSYFVNPVSNTTYSLLGTAGACSGFTTIVISTKPNPSLSVSASSTVVCDGTSANLTVTGDALTYTWSPGNQNGTNITVSPSVTTLFSVTGTNSVNCVSSVNQVIIVTPNPTITATPSSSLVCINGDATLTASGAASYTWDSGTASNTVDVNPSASTVYSVTGSYTTGCSSTGTVEVDVLTPTIAVSGNTVVCTGSNVVISASGADTYLWSTGSNGASTNVSPTLTTVYTVTGSVTDPISFLSCDASNSVQVTVNANPVVSITANHSVICIGTSAILTAGGADSYTWTGGSGTIANASISVNPIANQTFSVAGTDNNGCIGKTSMMVQVSTCNGISSISPDVSVLIYPNPSNGEFTVRADENMALQIVNELGQQVKTIVLDDHTHEARISNLSNGIYFVTGSTANGSVKQKIVIAK